MLETISSPKTAAWNNADCTNGFRSDSCWSRMSACSAILSAILLPLLIGLILRLCHNIHRQFRLAEGGDNLGHLIPRRSAVGLEIHRFRISIMLLDFVRHHVDVHRLV